MPTADPLAGTGTGEALRDRTRASLWVILACVALFALADLGVPRSVFPLVYTLKALQVVLVLTLFLALRGRGGPTRTRAVALLMVNGTYVLMAVGDTLKGHLETTPLLAVVAAMSAAAVLPWGLGPQLATVGLLEAGNLWTLGLTGRSLEHLIDPAASVTAALGFSVYVAHQLACYRHDRQRTEAALAARARLQALRADVRVGVLVPASLTHALTLCAEALVQHLGAAVARIWTLAADGATLELQASAGLSGIAGAADLEAARVPVGRALAGAVARRRRPLLTNDVAAETSDAERGWAARHGLLAFAGHPLTVEERLVGVVALYAREPLGELAAEALEATAEAISLTIDRTRAEEARTRLLGELEHANRLKSEFVSTMSHELRTPLNVITGYLDMLEDPEWADPSLALDRIRHANRELLELVEATLDLNRLEAARDRLWLEDVALETLWRELADELTGRPRAPAVRLTWEPVPAVVLRTDRRKLKTIVRNLVGNALKFTPSGEVVVSATCEEQALRLTVRDSGIGIPAEHLPHVFDVFRQVDSSDRRAYGGVGLGLHIVRRFCEQIAGTVTVASTPGRGTTFRVTLPLVVEEPAPTPS